ncbi:MAG TPA: hypothetical protein VKE74_31175, partial [Gemmataceae bacterium]|nr:hypothetical protein [Gemmataceae bacterium]
RLPGVRSPDGTKSVELGETQSTLHQLGQPPRALGGGFHVELDPHLLVIRRVPVLWLDNERFLTQTSNGVLVTVSLDGTRKPVVSVPMDLELGGFPRLHRDLAGRIIYDGFTPGFVVDVDARTWEQCEWVALGHEFEADWGSSELRYKGRRIEGLKCWPHWEGRTATTEGYIAMMTGMYQDEVRVWSTTGEWFTIDVRPECLIGWVR